MNSFHFGDAPAPAPGTRRVTMPAEIESREQLFTFLEEALQLPGYFGHNWDALEECLGELSEGKITWVLVHRDVPLPGKLPDQRVYLRILAASVSRHLEIVFAKKDRPHVTALLTGS